METVTVQLASEDFRAFTKIAGARGRSFRRGLVLFAIAGALFASAYFLSSHIAPHKSLEQILLRWALFAGLLFFFLRRRLASVEIYKETSPGAFLPNRYELREDGLFDENERGQSFHRWSAFDDILETQNHYFLMLAKRSGHIFPKRCFATPDAAAAFAAEARRCLERRKSSGEAHV